jgi:hypothetical protein
MPRFGRSLRSSAKRLWTYATGDSQEAAEAFFTDELREKVTELYGVSPTVTYLEIAELKSHGTAHIKRGARVTQFAGSEILK